MADVIAQDRKKTIAVVTERRVNTTPAGFMKLRPHATTRHPRLIVAWIIYKSMVTLVTKASRTTKVIIDNDHILLAKRACASCERALTTATPDIPCLRAARASQSCFSQMNPVTKNRLVQICRGARSTTSLTPITEVPMRRSIDETPNCPAGPFMHFTASTKFRNQRNEKNAVPTNPISSKNCSIAL